MWENCHEMMLPRWHHQPGQYLVIENLGIVADFANENHERVRVQHYCIVIPVEDQHHRITVISNLLN